jgi:hypothetical protein
MLNRSLRSMLSFRGRTDVLQLSGRLAGDVKESRNDSPTRDLQMAADRTRPHSAAMLADSLAGENPARGTCPVATVVISGDGAGDQSVGSLEVCAEQRVVQEG